MTGGPEEKIPDPAVAVWALTSKAAALGVKIASTLDGAGLWIPAGRSHAVGDFPHTCFDHFSSALAKYFHAFSGHVFIMAAGIVVRCLSPLLKDKFHDPAVVVMDESGKFAVSLISGHVGGANALCRRLEARMGAAAVITTATDVNQIPAIDVLASEMGLFMENPSAVKGVSSALLEEKTVLIHDPDKRIWPFFKNHPGGVRVDFSKPSAGDRRGPGIFVDTAVMDTGGPDVLILRPKTLVIGVGCNKNTPAREIMDAVDGFFAENRLSLAAVVRVASVNIKKDEPGISAMAARLKADLCFFDKSRLKNIKGVKTPSKTVQHHIGISSVCEAAAIAAAEAPLIIPKKKATKNVTFAVAKIVSTS